LEETLSGTENVGFAWLVLVAFVRISTNPRVMAEPFDVNEAIDMVESWLGRPNASMVNPTERHPEVWRNLPERVGAGGNLTSDAHLAALAIEHGAELCSADNDFARFPGLRWVNPLA
jgi:toxin-antitoxin system PIN domain toxin